MIKKALVFLIVLSITGYVLADDNYSIRIACTIPAIPGVNAPSIIEEKVVESKIDKNIPSESKNDKEENDTKSSLTIQEETKRERVSTEQETIFIRIQTIYAR